MAVFQKTLEFEGDEELLAKGVKNIVTDIIKIHVEDIQSPFRTADTKYIDEPFSHLVLVSEDDGRTCNTAQI